MEFLIIPNATFSLHDNATPQRPPHEEGGGGGVDVDGIWRKVAAQRWGVLRPELCLTKTVTKTDASKDQHRLEISTDDVEKSLGLMELGVRANTRSVDVKVIDRMGREYVLVFKFIESNHRYRFMGSDWGRLIRDNGVEEGQVLSIWGLPERSRGGGSYGFAFVN